MSKRINRKQSVEARVSEQDRFNQGTWMFCQNGYQSTGVDISVEQFDMLKELVTDASVVEYYEKLRSA
jgi:hypothetical protein